MIPGRKVEEKTKKNTWNKSGRKNKKEYLEEKWKKKQKRIPGRKVKEKTKNNTWKKSGRKNKKEYLEEK
jgi:hypothetical protein